MADDDSAVDEIKASGNESRKNSAFNSLANSALQKQNAYENYYQSLQDASNKSSLLKEGAGIDLLQGAQDGAYQLLNTLINQGYIDADQRDSILKNLNAVGGLAAQYAQDGGVDPETMNALVGEYINNRNKANALAERGGLTTDEYQRILNSGRNDLMRQGRNAAESTFNQMNQGSPFAAGALMAQSAANTGAEMVKQRADLDKYQSDTRIKGNEQLNQLLALAADTVMQRGVNKSKGLDVLESLLNQQQDLASKSNSMSGGIYDYAKGTLDNLVKFNDVYNKKGQYMGTDVSTPYSGDNQPWEKNNKPYAPGMVEYGAGQGRFGKFGG